MVDEKVVSYIRTNLEKGYPLSAIQNKLQMSGVPRYIIEEATAAARQTADTSRMYPSPSQMQPRQVQPAPVQPRLEVRPRPPVQFPALQIEQEHEEEPKKSFHNIFSRGSPSLAEQVQMQRAQQRPSISQLAQKQSSKETQLLPGETYPKKKFWTTVAITLGIIFVLSLVAFFYLLKSL